MYHVFIRSGLNEKKWYLLYRLSTKEALDDRLDLLKSLDIKSSDIKVEEI